MEKIAYKSEDIQRIVLILNNVKVVGVDSCQIISEVARTLQNTGTLVKDGDEESANRNTEL